jgi:hypothetical protein
MALIIDPGRIRRQYPRQSSAQPIVADFYNNGIVRVHYNPEVGNAVPCDVVERLTLTKVHTKKDAQAWYRKYKFYIEDILTKIKHGEKFGGEIMALDYKSNVI